MTVMAAQEPLPTKDDLLSVFLSLDTPPGYKAELIEGVISVTPPPEARHEKNFSKVVVQVIRKSKTEMDVSANRGLELPHLGAGPMNHCIPDAVFAPEELDLFGKGGPWMAPDGVAMVVEVTSRDAENDRVKKRRSYAAGGIPLYLLIDRDHRNVVLYSDPAMDDVTGDDYKSSTSVFFGKPVPLPDPFGFELDTSDFV
jgi:Uma2 family endonuclease